MIKTFVEKWNTYKRDLEEYFRTTKQSEYDEYNKLVEALFDKVINRYEHDINCYDTENITVIDDGDYQGTQIFILHKRRYQPNVNDYVYTHNYYGSCSGCDTLMRNI